MEQYLDAAAKRRVQISLFSHVEKAKTILGLAGTHPEKYIKVLPICERIVLVDFNPINDKVKRNSLVGEFDLLSNMPAERNPINVVDCDFCKSILSCGDDLLYIYNKMKRNLVRNKYITFTFSLRGVGFERTMDWLLSNFPELKKEHDSTYNPIHLSLGDRKYITKYSSCLFKYRDSGDNMISGIIKL